MRIGIFDSGIGGEVIAASLSREFPDADIHVVNDRQNLPYGDKTGDEIIELTDRAIQPLLKQNCDIIILACNSATAEAITPLRHKYPTQLLIGLEPMVKPAVKLTKSGIIAVCATPATLNSERYRKLVNEHASHIKIIEPDCRNWAKMIEDNEIHEVDIKSTISQCLEQGADVIVLGCTHYHWIEELIKSIVRNDAVILEPSEAVARRVRVLLNL